MTDDVEHETEHPETPVAEAAESAGESVSPGRMLRSAREGQGVAIDALSASTALSKAIIESLENNRFDQLPQAVFVRGYYRKCAKALGMPEQELVDAYARWAGETVSPVVTPGQVDVIPSDVTPSGSRVLKTLLVIVLLVLGVAILWAWLPGFLGSLTGKDAGSTEAVTGIDHVAPAPGVRGSEAKDDASGPKPSLGSSNRPELGASDDVEPTSSPGPDLGARKLPTERTTVGSADQASSPTVSANDSGPADSKAGVSANKLVLEFNKRSWVSVQDADGTNLLKGIVEEGKRRVLKGQLPYDIVLGYAPGVDVTLGGRSIDFAGRIEADNTAKLTLGTSTQ